VIVIFTSFCSVPNDKKKIIIGDNSGKLYIGTLKIIIDFEDSTSKQSILDTYEEIYSFRSIGTFYDFSMKPQDRYPVIRNLIQLSDTEIVGHSDYGDVFILNFEHNGIDVQILEIGDFNRKKRMHQIASINPNNFLTCGNYGNFWVYNRNDDGSWTFDNLIFNEDAHYALDVFNKDSYIVNNYYGKTSIIDESCKKKAGLFGFNSNLQKIIVHNELIAAVDYNGNSHLYSKSSSNANNYIKLQTIDCDETKVFPRLLYHNEHFYAAFPNKFWKFDLELEKIQNFDLKCKDIIQLNEDILVLTKDEIVTINPNSLIIPENYINYNYLKIGIIGYTDTGKSTFCYKMIYDDYKDDLGTTSGTLTWCLELDDGNKIFIKDIPGQHDEIEFYFPKLKDCDLILAMCKIKDSIKPWKETIEMCDTLRTKYNIEHFIFLRSQSDEKEKAPKSAIEQLLERNNFDKNMLIDVSAKESIGISEIIEKLSSSIFWEKKRISTENKIKTKLIYAIGEARDSKTEKINLDSFALPGYSGLNKSILENLINKVADEDNIYYIPSTKDIILNTENMGLVQSFILEGIFSISDGLINKNVVMAKLYRNFGAIDKEDLQFYYEDFINYLLNEGEILELLPDVFIIRKYLKHELEVPADLLCTEIRVKIPIPIFEIISIFESSGGSLEEVSQNAFKFSYRDGGVIYIIIPEIDQFDINTKSNYFMIYLKTSDKIEGIFHELYDLFRTYELTDLPRILDFEKKSDDDLENLYYLFNYPDETPVIDFKREISFERKKNNVYKKIHKEILKDVIALGNSSYLYDNSAYLVIGIEENNGTYKKIQDVHNRSTIIQQIVFLCRRFINHVYNITPITIKVNKIYNMIQEKKIKKQIPFTQEQKKSTCEDKILILNIKRNKKECLELNETISWKSKKGIKKIRKGTSWIRLGPHTFEISNQERKKLFQI